MARWAHHHLYLWADRIDLAFGLWLPRTHRPIDGVTTGILGTGRTVPRVGISIRPLPANVLGEYHYGRERIVMNAARLDRLDGAVLATLAHELLHCWEDHWAANPGPGNWHSDAFIDRARRHGLLSDRQGRQRVIPGGQFARLLT